MKTYINKPVYVAIITAVAVFLSFLILKQPNFEVAPGQTFNNTISAVIVPHHDLVSDLRQQTLFKVAEKVNPKTIILVSTNHFNSGGRNVITTDKNWRLKNSYLEADKGKIAKLNLVSDEAAFSREHGIINLLQPVKNAFPDAKIIPLILKPNQDESEIGTLVQNLDKVCFNQCLVVASVDFSHYQPGALAEVHDRFVIKALSQENSQLVGSGETDSPEALTLAVSWAKKRGTKEFKVWANTNSGQVENSPDAESTSYVFGWFDRQKVEKSLLETFMAGFNLDKFLDPRFTSGIDQKVDLAQEREMALLCLENEAYCPVNQLFWNAPFWREAQNGLVMAGTISQGNYSLVLLPTDNNGRLLKGDAKLTVINRIRQKIGLKPVKIEYGYDKIDLNLEQLEAIYK